MYAKSEICRRLLYTSLNIAPGLTVQVSLERKNGIRYTSVHWSLKLLLTTGHSVFHCLWGPFSNRTWALSAQLSPDSPLGFKCQPPADSQIEHPCPPCALSILCPRSTLFCFHGDSTVGDGKRFLCKLNKLQGFCFLIWNNDKQDTNVLWPSSFKIDLPWGAWNCFEKADFRNVLKDNILLLLILTEDQLVFMSQYQSSSNDVKYTLLCHIKKHKGSSFFPRRKWANFCHILNSIVAVGSSSKRQLVPENQSVLGLISLKTCII